MTSKITSEDYITRKDLEDFGVKLSRNITDEISEVMSQYAYNIGIRFNSLEEKFVNIEKSIDRLTNTLNGFVKRLEETEVENTARDAKYNRLLEWAKKVSKQTGIPIEY